MHSNEESILKRIAITGVILPFAVICFIIFLVSQIEDSKQALLLGSELGQYYFYYLGVLVFALLVWKTYEKTKLKKRPNLEHSKRQVNKIGEDEAIWRCC
jgi:hypothetical protein